MATRSKPLARLAVRKTLKMLSGGAFIRSESGRVIPIPAAKGGDVVNVPHASRKDLRNAVVAARKAQPGWAGRSAFNQAQILYRAAEMLEGRRESFLARMQEAHGQSAEQATRELDTAIDTLVGYAGWCDKIPQVMGSTNPVAAPFFNLTAPEPLGVVVAFAPESPPLLGAVAAIAPIIAGGNTCIVLLPPQSARVGLELGEALATSDLPAGVVNLLSTHPAELVDVVAGHADIDGILAIHPDSDTHTRIESLGAQSLKRTSIVPDPPDPRSDAEDIVSPYRMLPFLEFKTAWHPIGT